MLMWASPTQAGEDGLEPARQPTQLSVFVSPRGAADTNWKDAPSDRQARLRRDAALCWN